jgi:hypothetical protein
MNRADLTSANPTRKRLRREIRCCRECEYCQTISLCLDLNPLGQRRKVKCEPSSQDGRSCAQCLRYGVECSIADAGAPDHGADHKESPASQDGRLERIESLLQRLVERAERDPSRFDDDDNTSRSDLERLVRESTATLDGSPVLDLFQNGLVNICS